MCDNPICCELCGECIVCFQKEPCQSRFAKDGEHVVPKGMDIVILINRLFEHGVKIMAEKAVDQFEEIKKEKEAIMEDSAQYNKSPAQHIRDRRKVLENKIRQAVEEFKAEVDLAVTHVNVNFVETTTVDGKYETQITGVRVTLEDS